MDIHIYVVILCVSGLLNLHHVFGEIDNSVSILNDIRNELNNLKLSNERNERKIMSLERQVNECHTKYAELSKQITTVAPIENRFAHIEHKVEASHQELLKRLEAVEMSRTAGKEHDKTDNSGTAEEDEQLKMNFNAEEKENEPDLTESKERESHMDKRIIPVTGPPTGNTKIAFSAYTSRQLVQAEKGHIIPFDSVHTNVGQAFNPTSHIFTCPVSGTYYFASALFAQKHLYAISDIVKEGSKIAVIYSKSDSGIHEQGYDQGFNSVLTLCNKGERVWVQLETGYVFERKSHIDKRNIPVTSPPTGYTKIAFSAAYTSHQLDQSGSGHIIPFDSVYPNVGQAFNSTTHIFTCPVSGMYYFASALLAREHQYARSAIVKEGGTLAVIYSTPDSGFKSVLAICNKGFRVWMRIDAGDVLAGQLSTFSGFLLWEL